MRLHDRHLAPAVSGINCLTGVRYRIHEDEDSVDDSDYSLADEGEAQYQISSRTKQRQERTKPILARRKAQPDVDDGSVSSEDGSFFTVPSRNSDLIHGEVLIQQLSFDSGPTREGRKHSIILMTSPSITKKDDMLMSKDNSDDDNDDFQNHSQGCSLSTDSCSSIEILNPVRLALLSALPRNTGSSPNRLDIVEDLSSRSSPSKARPDPIPDLASVLLGDDLDDNSSTLSSLFGEEHLFLRRAESNASLKGFKISFDEQESVDISADTGGLHSVDVSTSTKYPPPMSSAILSTTDSWSSDEILRPKRTAMPFKYQRPRDRFNSAASSSSLIFNYSDGEASFAANTDPKSQSLPVKRRIINAKNQLECIDNINSRDNHQVLHIVPTKAEQSTETFAYFVYQSMNQSAIPDNDIPAIKSLASGSSSSYSISYLKSPHQATRKSSQQLMESDKLSPSQDSISYLNCPDPKNKSSQQLMESDKCSTSVVALKDSFTTPDLVLDDLDWEAPIDHSFTTTDTPPFFTISIPKNWKQQEESKGHLRQNGNSGQARDAKYPKESSKGKKNGAASLSAKRQKELFNGRPISFRADSLSNRNSKDETVSDRCRTRSFSKPRRGLQQANNSKAERSQKHHSNLTANNSSNYLETNVSKPGLNEDDNRSVSSHHTFWSTQSDGLLVQRCMMKDTSILRIKQEDIAKDDTKSVQSKNSFSSFRSFFSSMSWKVSNLLKPRAHRSRREGKKACNDSKTNTRWYWLLRIFRGKKDNRRTSRGGKKKSMESVSTSYHFDEELTTPTAALSELSFLSENGNLSSVTGSVKLTNTEDQSSQYLSSFNMLHDDVKPPKPTLSHLNKYDNNASIDNHRNSRMVASVRHGLSKTSVSLTSHNNLVSIEANDTGRNMLRTKESVEHLNHASQTRSFKEDVEITKRPAITSTNPMEHLVVSAVTQLPELKNTNSVNQAPIITRDAKSSLLSDGLIYEGKLNYPKSYSNDDRHTHNRQSQHSAKMVVGQVPPSTKTVGKINPTIPKAPCRHHRCSSVGSSGSMLSASSRGTVNSNSSSKSNGSIQSKASVNCAVTEISATIHHGTTKSVILSRSRINNNSTSDCNNNSKENLSHPRINQSVVRSPKTSRRTQSSGSSVVSRASSVASWESHASNTSTLSRSTADSMSSKKGLSSTSSVVSGNSTKTWSSRGSWETVSTRDPCARQSKIVRKSSHLQQLTEKGDGDVWIERLYKSKRSGEYKVYFVSTNTGKRSRDEPPSGASKVIYRDYDARFN